MNKKYQIKTLVFFLTLIFCSNLKTVIANSNCITNNDIREKVLNLPSQLELRYNDQVKEQIEFFVEKNKKLSSALLGRAPMYFPMIEATLAANNLPDELKYLPVIEAGLVPYLTSHAGASGLWQFMPATGEQFGLKITNTIDERRDAEKSTAAAATYLKRLFNIYKEWTLVLAAYNCGDGVLNKALKKSSSRSYWDIQQYLPQQTQEFVPKFIAASYLMTYYYDHNLVPTPLEDDYVYTASIKVFEKIELQKIAENYSINIEILKRLNAVYIKGFIPESNGEYLLYLPESKIYDFANANNSVANIVSYSSASIGRQKDAMALAEVKTQQEIKSRESLPVNGLPFSNNALVKTKHSSIRFEDEVIVKIVKLTKGKSLSDIAKENGTDIASLIDLNKIDTKYPPRIGDDIKVRI